MIHIMLLVKTLVKSQLLDLSKIVHKMFNYKIDDEIDIVTVIYKTSSLFSILFLHLE